MCSNVVIITFDSIVFDLLRTSTSTELNKHHNTKGTNKEATLLATRFTRERKLRFRRKSIPFICATRHLLYN